MRLAALPDVAAILRDAEKRRLGPAPDDRAIVLDREAIEALVPHRGPCLLLDRVTHLDASEGVVVARCDLRRYATVFAGHFPGRPLWPGVLQVEAIGQAGLVLQSRRSPAGPTGTALGLTDILAARFLRPIGPDADVEVVARVMEDGLFRVVVGQCLVGGVVCSAAAVRGIEGGAKG